MKTRNSILFIFVIVVLLGMTSTAYADPELEINSEIDFWFTLYEANENGIQQASTQDPAVDEVSGFNIKTGRLSFLFDEPERKLGGKFQLRLEEKVDIMDFYIHWYPKDTFQLYLGQMKVPSTYEAMCGNGELDFISRSTLAGLLTDWSLSRTSYFSTFYGNKSVYRDAGIGVKGSCQNEEGHEYFKYFFMIGNGLGHSLYIGGHESKEFIFANEFGDYFYGLRLDCMPVDNLTFGGHYSINKHDNTLFNDEQTVFDLKRNSHSVDVRYNLPDVRLAFMYGGGVINDDYFHTGEKNLDYSGWEAKVVVPLDENIEAGLRYDNYSYRAHGVENTTHQNNLTLGFNYLVDQDMRLQLNYMMKDTDDNINADLDDDILYLNFQYFFNSGNVIKRDSDKNKTKADKDKTKADKDKTKKDKDKTKADKKEENSSD